MKTIGIIGYGYVGRAVAAAYEPSQVLINDIVDAGVSVAELKSKCQIIFVCVPTPQYADGSCDTSTLLDVISQLKNFPGLIICKSTATPQVYADIESQNPDLKIAHVPEFLTAANATKDYLKPLQIVVGCKPELHTEVVDAILTEKITCNKTNIKLSTIAEAAMFKYVANTFLAMKVVINNEYYELCRALKIDWNNVASIASTDPRLGTSHWQVPGHDGSRGFGGACFPKDTLALLALANFMSTDPSMLSAAVKKNKKLRS